MQETVAQPPIEAYLPPKLYTQESAVDVVALNDCIEKVDLPSAVTVYKALVANGTEIPADVKQSLLELVAFYNEASPLPVDSFEERDVVDGLSRRRDYTSPEWRSGGFADRLFESIEPKTAAAYNTMILGLTKYKKTQQANALFDEVAGKNVPIDTTTYNAIIATQYEIFPRSEDRWRSAERLLQLMNERQVPPNVHTMNVILEVIRNAGGYEWQRQKALSVLAEFKALNIEPSVGSWYHILRIFCKDRVPASGILVDILNHLGDSELKCEHEEDMSFFSTAMTVCCNHLKDFELATRVDRLLNVGNNHHLIGNSFTKRSYYRNYMLLALHSLPLPQFIEIFDDIVPNVHSLELNLSDAIISKINENGSIEYIPKFWSDMLIGGLLQHRFNRTVEEYLDVMCENPPQPDVPAHAGLNDRFAECAWNYWQKLTFEVANERVTNLAAEVLGKLLLLCARQKNLERATEIFDALVEGARKTYVTGTASYESLSAFVSLCTENKQPSLAINALEYAVERGLSESVELGKLITDTFTLSERDTRKVNHLVGQNVRTNNTEHSWF